MAECRAAKVTSLSEPPVNSPAILASDWSDLGHVPASLLATGMAWTRAVKVL